MYVCAIEMLILMGYLVSHLRTKYPTSGYWCLWCYSECISTPGRVTSQASYSPEYIAPTQESILDTGYHKCWHFWTIVVRVQYIAANYNSNKRFNSQQLDHAPCCKSNAGYFQEGRLIYNIQSYLETTGEIHHYSNVWNFVISSRDTSHSQFCIQNQYRDTANFRP